MFGYINKKCLLFTYYNSKLYLINFWMDSFNRFIYDICIIEYLYRNQTGKDNFRSTFVYCRKRSRTVSIKYILSLKFEVYNHFRRHFTTANQLHYEHYNGNIIINVNNERLSNLMLYLLGWVGYCLSSYNFSFSILPSFTMQFSNQCTRIHTHYVSLLFKYCWKIWYRFTNFKICSQFVSL